MEKKSQNCWDFMDCPEDHKNKCDAFKDNMGVECWLIFHSRGGCRGLEEGNDCTECLWYKKVNSIE
ncbi:MAG: hypothetical protein OEV93_02145 [Candidatus Moranbacteria bacterium]|nr:hypothetical protein [Candidatus Moranbacteria bacterium]